MKNFIYFLFTLIPFITCNAGHVPPVRSLVIPMALGTICIDGVDDEAGWSAKQSTSSFSPGEGYGNDADYSFSFKVCYDATYLYIYGKISDDYESPWEWGSPNPWIYDNVEVFFDLDTNGSGNNPAYDTNTYQLRINRGIDSIGDNCGRLGDSIMRPMHKYYWENTADGWLFEAALHWKFVLGTGQKVEDILTYMDGDVVSGFDVHGTDSDTDFGGNADCRNAWDRDEPDDAADRTEDNAWNNRTVFGTVTFDCYGCTPWPPISTNEISVINNLSIFPNPANNYLQINNDLVITGYEIIDILGNIIIKEAGAISNNKINISQLPTNNIYMLKVTDNNGIISSAKFIKE